MCLQRFKKHLKNADILPIFELLGVNSHTDFARDFNCRLTAGSPLVPLQKYFRKIFLPFKQSNHKPFCKDPNFLAL